MTNKDYYKILGVPENANAKQIKKEYRKLVIKYHPDMASGNAEKFIEIKEAYDVLIDEIKRSNYDKETAQETKNNYNDTSNSYKEPFVKNETNQKYNDNYYSGKANNFDWIPKALIFFLNIFGIVISIILFLCSFACSSEVLRAFSFILFSASLGIKFFESLENKWFYIFTILVSLILFFAWQIIVAILVFILIIKIETIFFK